MNFEFLHKPGNIITVAENGYPQDGQMVFICTVINEANNSRMRKRGTHHFPGDQYSAVTGTHNQGMSLCILGVNTIIAEHSPAEADSAHQEQDRFHRAHLNAEGDPFRQNNKCRHKRKDSSYNNRFEYRNDLINAGILP
ncbi:hypothetical protein D3C73_795210 [compost metagenome]